MNYIRQSVPWITTILLLAFISGLRSEIYEVGSVTDAAASNGHSPLQGSDVYLTDYVISRDGILFVFSVKFYTSSPLSLQIYEQADSGNSSVLRYRLMTELSVLPSVISKREDIYIEALLTQPCLKVKAGQRLGVRFQGPVPTLRYSFDLSMGVYKPINTTFIPTVGQINQFDSIKLPYAFALSAHVFTDVSISASNTSLIDCIPGLVIPNSIHSVAITTRNPVTGAMGATGASGVKGFTGAIGEPGEALPGPMGDTGPPGVMGVLGSMGPPGNLGATGAPGSFGSVGLTGATGYIGQQGYTGATGAVGSVGRPGQDLIVPLWGSNSLGEGLQNLSSALVTETDFWRKKETMIGAYIWLAIVSFTTILSLLILSVISYLHWAAINNYNSDSSKGSF